MLAVGNPGRPVYKGRGMSIDGLIERLAGLFGVSILVDFPLCRTAQFGVKGGKKSEAVRKGRRCYSGE